MLMPMLLMLAATAGAIPPRAEVSYGADPLQKMDIYMPPRTPAPVVVIVHGGGWSTGDRCVVYGASLGGCRWGSVILEGALREFSSEAIVVVPNYRLAPANPYPAAVEDLKDVLAWIYGSGGRSIGALPQVVVVGESAGANLGAMISVDGEFPVNGFVGYGGYYDLTSVGTSEDAYDRAIKYAGCERERCPRIWAALSPRFQVGRKTPMLLLHGGADNFSGPEQAFAMAEQIGARSATVLAFRGWPHVGPLFVQPEVSKHVYEFIRERLAVEE